jgi:hypothetical protein
MSTPLTRRLAAMEVLLASSRREPAYFHGYTMLPLLREGDEVETEPIDWQDVRLGDVVTYRFGDRFPTRRVVAVDRAQRCFIICGDSIPPPQEFRVRFEDVIARVVRRRRNGVWLTTASAAWRLQKARVLVHQHLRRARWLTGPRHVWRRVRRLG